QLAHPVPARQGPGPGARRQRVEALLERDEQAPARHGDGGARPGGAVVARRGRQPRRRELAAVVALLPGVVDLGRDERDPAEHHRRTRARAPPRADGLTSTARNAPGTTFMTMTSGKPGAFETVRYEVDGSVCTITLDRPESANAQNTR